MSNVTLIDYTGSGHPDPLRAARVLVYAKSTRLTQGEITRQKVQNMSLEELHTELASVANSVRSSWEFVSFTFEIRDVTRAFTHQLVRTRYGVSFAQQAQRVVDMSEFGYRTPGTIAFAKQEQLWQLCMQMIASTYKTLRDHGIPAQDARGVLPTNVLTNILARFDLRALADMMGKRINPRAQDEYTEVAEQMRAEVYKVHPWTKMFLEPERTNTPAIDSILKELLGTQSPVDLPLVNQALKELDSLKATWG